MTTSQSANLAARGEVKRGRHSTEPKARLTGGGEAPTDRSEFFTCRFEDRIAQRALALTGRVARIAVRHPHDLDAAFAAIAAAQRNGHWVALLLDYALGAWLDPAQVAHAADGAPRLTALIYRDAVWEAPWPDALEDVRIASLTPRITRADHQRAVADVQRRIRAGQCYQVNVTFPQDVCVGAPSPPTPLPLAGEGCMVAPLFVPSPAGGRGCPAGAGEGTAQSLYRRIASHHPSAHAAYIEDEGRSVLSFSPELFVARQGDTLTTRPMKGTAPRVSDDPQADAGQGQALLASAKNRAENLMIVDLLRNDLGRIATTGSVRVDKLFELERYPSVWTLTSTVRARAPGATLRDVLTALFPCGSVTGAPKIAAMRAIAELESAPRGLYCGSLGWLAPNGDFSLNVAIRTLVLDDAGYGACAGVYPVGGGIVLDSDAALEWQECQWKSRIVQSA